MSFILADGWLITMNERREILERASVCVENDRIAAVGSRQQLQQKYPGAEVVDCSDRIVMPGMVNTHTHLFQTLLKGLGDDMVLINRRADGTLEIRDDLIFHGGSGATLEMREYGATALRRLAWRSRRACRPQPGTRRGGQRPAFPHRPSLRQSQSDRTRG